MKHWKCPKCGREHESKDDVVTSICRGCLNKMDEIIFKQLKGKTNGKSNT